MQEQKDQIKKNHLNQLKFPVSKVKKIIQENQEVGKINNVVPFLLSIMSKSLEMFLSDVLMQCKLNLKEKKISKATPGLLKNVLHDSKYDFMKEFGQQLPDLEEGKKKKKQFSDDELEKKVRKQKKVKKQLSDDDEDYDG